MGKKTFRIATLGCRTNQYESQAYRDQLEALGYVEAERDEEADIAVVNTCTVTESADRSSRLKIRQLKKKTKGQLVVTGCLAERVGEMSEPSLVVLNKEKERLVDLALPSEEVPEFSIKHFEAHTRAFVKVQDGCNSFCTYCIIPYVRGRSKCRPLSQVIEEVNKLISNGYKEVVITGINVGDYRDGEYALADLIRAVDEVKGLERLRLSSIDPDEVDDDLLEAIVHGKNTCQSMHIVLQAGSNVILKRMNRKYTRQMFYDTVERLKKASPDFTFTTDVIVGFPGESEADFEETLEVMREVQFAKVHMFPYSPRERTRAALFPNRVDSKTMVRRKDEVLRLSEKIAFSLREQYVGRKMWVLTESDDEGHTGNFLKVLLPKGMFRPNTLVKVFLKSNTQEGLIADV